MCYPFVVFEWWHRSFYRQERWSVNCADARSISDLHKIIIFNKNYRPCCRCRGETLFFHKLRISYTRDFFFFIERGNCPEAHKKSGFLPGHPESNRKRARAHLAEENSVFRLVVFLMSKLQWKLFMFIRRLKQCCFPNNWCGMNL